MEFDRYLRFRHLEPRPTLADSPAADAFILRREGVLATHAHQPHEETFRAAFHPLPGDLLELEYPASYGYFRFTENGKSLWVYTTKTT